MTKRIAGELIEMEIPSREGVVFLTAKYVYKLFGKRTNPYDELFKYKNAEARGVPVPDTAKFTASLQDGSTTETVGGLRSTRVAGRFFQLSKRGGEKTLINEIYKITDSGTMEKVIAALTNAGAFGVTDPQGFINIHSLTPIVFIDLHHRNSPTHSTFQGALLAAETQLLEL